MKKLHKILFSFLSISLALMIICAPALDLYAAEDGESRGPQSSVGTTGTIGTQGVVGTTGDVGPVDQYEVESTNNTADLNNSNTGQDSTNTNTSTNNSTTDISSTNTSTINNNVELDLNTGNTNLNANTEVGQVSTGNVQGSVAVINAGNTTLVNSSVSTQTINANGSGQIVLNPSANRTAISSNTDTGQDSTNQNIINGNNIVHVDTTNNAEANNAYDVNINTGNINANQNTKIAGITTGGADLGLVTINALNSLNPIELSVDVYNILGNFDGTIVIPQLANTSTGQDSLNKNDLEVNRTTRASIANNATALNTLDVHTNTGGVDLGQNTQVGNVITGNTRVNGSVVNVATNDTPMFYLVNVYGTWNGTLEGIDSKYIIVQDMNSQTGQGSENTNTTTLNTDTDLSVTNNALATNDYKVNVNTGNISANKNTMVGNIETGGVNISLNTFNILNSASAGLKKISLGIINIFGNFNGNVASKPVATTDTSVSQSATVNASITQTSDGSVHINMPSADGTSSVNVEIDRKPSSGPSVTNKTSINPSNPIKMIPIIKAMYTPASQYVTRYITYYEPQTIEWYEDVPTLATALQANALGVPGQKDIPQSFWYTAASGVGLLALWGLSEFLSRNKG